MPENAVRFFTGRPPSLILEEGGTQAWALNARRVRKCEYAVLIQNRHTYDKFSPTEPHGTVFMVGRISSVDLSEEQPNPEEGLPERYIVRFSEYARVFIPNAWDGSRNPVGYGDLEADYGINPAELKFMPMPDLSDEVRVLDLEPMASKSDQPLTLAQAKAGLALTFGVPPESIEITIRG